MPYCSFYTTQKNRDMRATTRDDLFRQCYIHHNFALNHIILRNLFWEQLPIYLRVLPSLPLFKFFCFRYNYHDLLFYTLEYCMHKLPYCIFFIITLMDDILFYFLFMLRNLCLFTIDHRCK